MDLTFPSHTFYGVEFPAVVNNVETAIEMLGGLSQISEVFADEKRRLNLSFRPHMVYSKPACGDGRSSNSFIIRIQRLRNKVTGELKLVPVILGRVTRVYKFDAMADFQFGPFERVPTTDTSEASKVIPPNYKIFYNDLIIKDPTTMIDSYLSRDMPLYLPPVLFSRQDTPSFYNFAPRYRTTEYIQLEEKSHKMPILPSVAYYMIRGPWSRAWIRYGYDPRKDPEARRYQVIDFRVQAYMVVRKLLCHSSSRKRMLCTDANKRVLADCRKSYESVHSREDSFWDELLNSSKKSQEDNIDYDGNDELDPTIIDDAEDDDGDDRIQKNLGKVADYRFGPNNWPTTHQVRYCLSDIEIPEVQAMLEEVPERTEIDPVDGWLRPGGIKRIRDLLGQYLKNTLPSIMDSASKEKISFNSKIHCVYTSVGINHFSGCSSIIAVRSSNKSTFETILAFGSSHFICLAKSYSYLNDEMINLNTDFSQDNFRVYQTLPGHNSDVRCVRWLDCCFHNNGSSQVYQHTMCFLMSSDSCGLVIIWACPTESLICPDETENWHIINKFQTPNNSIINSIDGNFFPSSENDRSCSGTLFLSAAADTSVHNWSVHISQNLLTNKSILLPCILISNITRVPSLCLCLRRFCIKYNFQTSSDNIDVSWLHFIVLGLDNGQTEIWSGHLVNGQNENVKSLNFTLSTTISGHQDWTRCIDVCIDQGLTSPVVLIVTGGQDNIVRIWRLYSPENDNSVTSPGHAKTTESVLGFKKNQTRLHFVLFVGGSISVWCRSDKDFWLPALPLTGHVGPVADLSWMSTFPEEKFKDDDSYTYLLTAGFDQTVRLHACQPNTSNEEKELIQEFWFELARPQIHGYDMNAIASISPIFYVSAGDEKVVRVFTTTKDFLNSFKKLYKSPSICSKLDRILADSVIPTGAVQPPLGLSNQIISSPSNSNDNNVIENHNNIEDNSDRNEYVNNEEKENLDKVCTPNELPTEDRLQHATLWPEVKKLYGHPYEIYCLAVHPRQFLVASACTASKPEYAHIILWNGNSNWCIHQRLQHHQLTVTQLAWSHDGTRLLAVSRDRTWSLWSEQPMNSATEGTNHQLSKYILSAYPIKGQSHSRIIWTCAWSPDDKYFFTGSRDSSIYCWNATVKIQKSADCLPPEALRRLDIYKELGKSVTAIDVCESFNSECSSNLHSYLMAVGLESGNIILLKLCETGSSERFFTWSIVLNFPPDWCHVPGKRLRRISFSPQKDNYLKTSIKYMATSGDDGIVRIFKINIKLL
ncbi:elongator complex protein 2 [Schistosoma bovis]|uniref:Elongator complex protein 2 n=1 Tax=Schistosoma bovis TaxID=6184 RepID=A0A430QSN0_SCHBO|nr:elongator complex protein 2 [Schistosoma bovis]